MEEPMSMGNVATFLTKLWALVEDESYDDLICWSETGTSFHIIDQTSFAQNVLPVFFKHRNISSFIRQLNMYGFRKVSVVETGGVKPGRNDIEFSHPYFIYGREDLLEHIKRKAPVGRTEPAASTLLQRDDTRLLLQEVQKLRERQETFTTKMDAIKRENSALWKELAVMWQRHNKQQVVVSKLLQFLVGIMGKGATTGAGLKRSLLAPLQSAESNGPSMMKRTRASSPTPAQDTSITIEDVTDLTDDVNDSVMAASLLSPLSADVDHILAGIASPPTPDVQSIWNDHGQLVSTATSSLDSSSNSSVSLTTVPPQGLIVISPEGPTNFLANLQQTQQPQSSQKKLVYPSSSVSGIGNSKLAKILAPASTAAASTSIVPTPVASSTSVLKHSVVKNAAAAVPNANARLALKTALDMPLSTSSSSSVLKNSNSTAKIGQFKPIAAAAAAAATEMVGTPLLATGLATGTPSGGAPGPAKTYQLVPMSAYTASQQQGINSATRILGNNNNRVAARRPAQVKVTHPTPTAPLVSATQSVSSRALVKKTTNAVVSSAANNSLTDSSNFTSPVASDISGALDVTQSDLDTLQSMLASSQVTLNLDTLRELFSPESSMPGIPAIPDLLLPMDQQSMNYDDFMASLTEGHQELNSVFNVDDFINDSAATADIGTSSVGAGSNLKDQAVVRYANRD